MSLPTDPADLFARLIGGLAEVNFDGFEVFSWMEQERVSDIAHYIEGAALADEGLSSERVEELLDVADPDDFTPQVFATLLGLDRALMYANPYFGSFDQGNLTHVATRYARTGALNSDLSAGVLLPRCAFPARKSETPNSLNDVFAAVSWVPIAEWAHTEHLRIRPRNDLTRREREEGLEIACVPVVDDAQQFEWEVSERSGSRFFRVGIRAEAVDAEWARRLLAQLDVIGAHVAVLPELTLNEPLLALWCDILRESPPPGESVLKWIVAGSGNVQDGDRPVNRCVLLDRVTAETIAVQDKIHPFVITSEQLAEWQLTELLGSTLAEEDIVSGRRVTVIESRLGRIAILICEDLARIVDLAPRLRVQGISLVFAPVFSKETKPHHWEHVKAKEYATEVGSAVVVSNSLVVARRVDATGPWGTAMLHSPLTTQVRRSFQGDDVAQFTLLAGEPIPRTGDLSFEREDGPDQ